VIPLATTTVLIERPEAGVDPYDPATTYSIVASGVAAHISVPSGSEAAIGGEQARIDAVLLADTTDLTHRDRVTDDRGDTYEVAWVRQRVGLGLDHAKAGLRVFVGASNG